MKRNIFIRKINRDSNTQEIIEELIRYKFFIFKKCHDGKNLEINLMASRMFSSPKHIKLKNKILDRTKFLPTNTLLKDRLICIYHCLYFYPKCRFCGRSLIKFNSPLYFGYLETCGNKICVNAYGVENRGGIQYAVGKHIFSEAGLIGNRNAKRRCRKGLKLKDYIKDPSKEQEIRERFSKNANRHNTGFYSKYRMEFLNPNTNKLIILMSRYEINFVNICIENNIWFDSCHARLRYWNEFVNGFRWYNPDFIVKHNNIYYMIEIKPSTFLKKSTYSYNIISRNKIKRLYEHCLNYNRICLIITEKELKNENTVIQLLNSNKSNYQDYINEN